MSQTYHCSCLVSFQCALDCCEVTIVLPKLHSPSQSPATTGTSSKTTDTLCVVPIHSTVCRYSVPGKAAWVAVYILNWFIPTPIYLSVQILAGLTVAQFHQLPLLWILLEFVSLCSNHDNMLQCCYGELHSVL